MTSSVINELIKTSKSSGLEKEEERKVCAVMTGSPLPSDMSRVSHVKNVCVQSSADFYQQALQQELTRASLGVTMNKQ